MGLLAAQLGASRAWLTDYEPSVLEVAAANVVANGLPPERCPTARLDWRASLDAPLSLQASSGLLLAADVLYASVIAQPLADTLATLLRKPDGACLCRLAGGVRVYGGAGVCWCVCWCVGVCVGGGGGGG